MIAKRPRHLRLTVGLIAGAAILALSLAQPTIGEEAFSLANVRVQVKEDFRDVQHIGAAALTEWLAKGEEVLLLDVRESDEFAVSHLEGAQRVDPGIWRWTFMNRFGKSVAGKTVVFYCSVGVRSSRLAARVQAALGDAGVKAVFNLDGGIFTWHNERRPLTDGTGPTNFVHSFDARWGKLVDRQELTRTKPEQAVR